jgi:D-aminoacyl-tRNA deacylase
MIGLIQRVSEAQVKIEGETVASINSGLLILMGITHDDTIEDIEWLCQKIVNLRIFDDENGVMNKSCLDLDYDIITVSQFTLHARTKKGNRPSYIGAANPVIAMPLYDLFIREIDKLTNKKTQSGKFGANMQIQLINDGPVTIIIDSKNRM